MLPITIKQNTIILFKLGLWIFKNLLLVLLQHSKLVTHNYSCPACPRVRKRMSFKLPAFSCKMRLLQTSSLSRQIPNRLRRGEGGMQVITGGNGRKHKELVVVSRQTGRVFFRWTKCRSRIIEFLQWKNECMCFKGLNVNIRQDNSTDPAVQPSLPYIQLVLGAHFCNRIWNSPSGTEDQSVWNVLPRIPLPRLYCVVLRRTNHFVFIVCGCN
jgi:hypothetical protein